MEAALRDVKDATGSLPGSPVRAQTLSADKGMHDEGDDRMQAFEKLCEVVTRTRTVDKCKWHHKPRFWVSVI